MQSASQNITCSTIASLSTGTGTGPSRPNLYVLAPLQLLLHRREVREAGGGAAVARAARLVEVEVLEGVDDGVDAGTVGGEGRVARVGERDGHAAGLAPRHEGGQRGRDGGLAGRARAGDVDAVGAQATARLRLAGLARGDAVVGNDGFANGAGGVLGWWCGVAVAVAVVLVAIAIALIAVVTVTLVASSTGYGRAGGGGAGLSHSSGGGRALVGTSSALSAQLLVRCRGRSHVGACRHAEGSGSEAESYDGGELHVVGCLLARKEIDDGWSFDQGKVEGLVKSEVGLVREEKKSSCTSSISTGE
ncbi:FYVE-type zinc finger-containing protein [Apiospora arundinis]